MPDVPFVPGVPLLSSYTAQLPNLITSDAISLISQLVLGHPLWGIFTPFPLLLPVVVADNVLAVDFRREWLISNYPLELGAFESYDKVQLPFDVRVSFSAGGSQFNRQALIASVDAIAGSLATFTVITPEVMYQSVNVIGYDYRRTAQSGVGLLQVDVLCKQVRVSTFPAFSNTQAANGADATSGGTVSPGASTATIPGSGLPASAQ